MRTYLKTLARMFKKHATRLISIIFMVFICVGFIAGIGMAVEKIDLSADEYYRAQNVSDLIVKNTSENGFSEEDIAKAKERYGENNVTATAVFDVYLTVNGERQLVRLVFSDGEETVNVRESLETYKLEEEAEYLASAEEKDNKIKGIELDTEIELDFKDIFTQLAEKSGGEVNPMISMLPKRTVTVAETSRSPLLFALDGEPSLLNPEDMEIPDNINDINALILVENVLYLPYDVLEFFGRRIANPTDLNIASPVLRKETTLFTKRYESLVDEEASYLSSTFNDVRVLTLNDNSSFHTLNAYNQKVRGICLVFMVVFLLVTLLVVLSTMTRLIEEERAQIACLSTLGYPAPRIVFKYVLFAAIACGIGGVGAYFVDVGVAYLLYSAFNFSFVMPAMAKRASLAFYFIVYFSVVAVTLAVTAITGYHASREKPAVLLRPKAPKSGKKVFLERIPFIWNLLTFKYKSTMRNVLRYIYRFLMTVIAVAFSTALVTAGLGLLDLCLFQDLNSPTVMAVAVVVIIFAGLLTAVVIYTLTNINISERERELATLMVLGYRDGEVAGYIFREVYIDTAVGILFGYPCSAFFVWIVFAVVGLGSLGSMSWFIWLLSPVVIVLFTILVTLLLRRKIKRIQMNDSLKAVE